MSVSRTLSSILAMLLVAGGCNESTWQTTNEEDAASAVRQSREPVSDEEAIALGYEIENAIQNDDVESLIELFDMEEFQLSVHGEPLPRTADAAALREQTANTLKSILLSFGRLTDSCSLIGLRDRPAGKRLVFRIQGHGECLSYLEFAYARANDRVCLVDGYSHPLGERLSDAVRIDPPTENIRLEMENLKKRKVLREKMTAARSGDAQEFVKLYRELPWNEDSRRKCLVPLLMVAPSLNDTDFGMAVEEARRWFPNDVQVNLSLAWAYESRDGGLEALEPIDRVHEAIGGDPYLVAWKAGFLTAAGRNDEAKALVDGVLDESPLDWETVRSLLWNTLQRKDHSQATQVMDVIRRDFDDSAPDEIDVDGFAEFKESSIYKDWAAAQKAN